MTAVGRLPDLTGLRSLLADWRGRAGYLVEFVGRWAVPIGNNGDELLGRVFFRVLRELGITLVRRPSEADVLLVRPGGALLDRYLAPAMLARRLAQLPDLPLVIFPHSSWFERDDPATMFAGRRSPTLWISREQRSHDHLRGAWGESLARARVTLVLDHDVAVSGHAYVPEVLQEAAGRLDGDDGLLLVARMGVEAGHMDQDRSIDRGTWLRRLAASGLRRLPHPALAAIRQRTTRDRQIAANNRMLTAVTERLETPLPATMSPWCFDISDPTLTSVGRYAWAITGATAVVTDRLHVAVPAAILGKRTVFVEAGYHKASGVYEHSLRECEAVTFLRRA
jgi:hypothetical protein